MPKKIKFECVKYQFLIAAQRYSNRIVSDDSVTWVDFVNELSFDHDKRSVTISWKLGRFGKIAVPLNESKFYVRGDSEFSIRDQKLHGLLDVEDPIKIQNLVYFNKVVERVASLAGYEILDLSPGKGKTRFESEREFHDAWANNENLDQIDIRIANEACTAPEMRYITQRLGNLRGKKLLDVGCGLGEASVYFALLGADVTSTDLSQGMLDATVRLAEANGVDVFTHISAAEDLQLPADAKFDIIYMGNLLHHVDIDSTLSRVKRHLTTGGKLVTWDPLAYNPVINVYRKMATEVRTEDEHPLTWRDIKSFRKYFDQVETRYFWLTTLVIFLVMALGQRRDPNKERFWKVVVAEGAKWRWLYSPLEILDRGLLQIFPPIRLLCWNVVIIASDSSRSN